jgi:short-subunit dehydrogenase
MLPEAKHKSSTGRTAVVTGATSGIGKEYALYFAGQGYNLIITGRKRTLIMQVANSIRRLYGVGVTVIIADLSKREDFSHLMNMLEQNSNIEVLVNNAGYGMDNKFTEDHLDHQMDMLKVHIDAPVMLIHKVLPGMMVRKKGFIINVSSLAAFIPTAGNGMYSSTKSFFFMI